MKDNNMVVWDNCKTPDPNALTKIKGGRLSGMTDINPIWRLRMLTELFGPAGKGWYTEIVDMTTHEGSDGTIVASVVINLYWRTQAGGGDWNEWSKPVVGVGGSMLVAKEKSGLYTSDEAFKMAETDAISVACKKLGMAADIYWERGKTDSKYSRAPEEEPKKQGPLAPDMAIGLVNHIVKIGNELTSVESLAELWKDNIKQISRLPDGMKNDLTLWKDERKAELQYAELS